MTSNHHLNALPEGYNLLWFEIIKVIGKGGFGITYLAMDKNLNLQVAIKEYLPEDFASRIDENTVQAKSDEQQSLYDWGLERFITEARTLAKFNHPNIVKVLSVFEHNGTAYMVMEYAHGEDLSVIYKKRDPFSQEKYLDIFIPIMDGLALIHSAGYIHRDIKPANIYICENDAPILLDFGSARQSIEHQTKALTSLVTYGYAPFEQYNESDNKQGPWTDIYSLGASMYVGITGEKPVDALQRGGSFLEKGLDPYKPISVVAAGRFKENFLLAIDNALMFKIEDRPKQILTWADMLLGKTQAPQLPDYMLEEEVKDENEETIILDKDNSFPPTTAPSKGTQGLVDAYGKRSASEIDQSYPETQLEDAPQTGAKIDIDSESAQGPISSSVEAPKHSIAQLTIAAAVLLASIGTGIYIWQSPPLDTTPISPDQPVFNELTEKINKLLQSAHEKLQQGQFTSPANDSAAYFYSEIIKLDAAHPEANQGLKNIQQLLTDLTKQQISQQKWVDAEKILKEFETVFPGSQNISELRLLLQQAMGKQQTSQLLAKADIALANKQFTQPQQDNAYYYYKRIIELDPYNTQAINGLKQLETTLLSLAESEIKAQQYNKATAYLVQLKLINMSSEQAKTLRKRISQQTSESTQLANLLIKAEQQYKNKHFTSPKNDNAYDTYQQILTTAPGNNTAKSGIANIKKFYKRQFDKHIAASQISRAQRDLKVMKTIAAGERVTRVMTQTLRDKKRHLDKPKKTEIEQISDLMGEFKTQLEKRSTTKIKKMSQFIPGRQQFVEQLTRQYRSFDVQISNFKFIAKEHHATAQVELTNLVDKNDNQVTPGAWSRFTIKIEKNNQRQFKVYW